MLSDAEMAQLLRFINTKWSNASCNLCGVNSWSITGMVRLELTTTTGPAIVGGDNVPTAVAMCKNCGNTVLVNLVIAGIVSGRRT